MKGTWGIYKEDPFSEIAVWNSLGPRPQHDTSCSIIELSFLFDKRQLSQRQNSYISRYRHALSGKAIVENITSVMKRNQQYHHIVID